MIIIISIYTIYIYEWMKCKLVQYSPLKDEGAQMDVPPQSLSHPRPQLSLHYQVRQNWENKWQKGGKKVEGVSVSGKGWRGREGWEGNKVDIESQKVKEYRNNITWLCQ